VQNGGICHAHPLETYNPNCRKKANNDEISAYRHNPNDDIAYCVAVFAAMNGN
jgi:hypothetical protein